MQRRIEIKELCQTNNISSKEHAEQAIKMLGDELKFLFEPW